MLKLMKVHALQGSANLKFVEQMEKHTIRPVMLKHREFEFIILGIVSLTMSWTSKMMLKIKYFINSSCFCISVNINKDLCAI